MERYKSMFKEAPRTKKNNLQPGLPFFKMEVEIEHKVQWAQYLNKKLHIEYIYDGGNTVSFNCYITDKNNKIITEETKQSPNRTYDRSANLKGIASKYDTFIFKKMIDKYNSFKADIDYNELKQAYDTKNLRKLNLYTNKMEHENGVQVNIYYDIMFYIKTQSTEREIGQFRNEEITELYKTGNIKAFIM